MTRKMNVNDAARIGQDKLNIPQPLFKKSLEVARNELQCRPEDAGALTLVIALLGITKAHEMKGQLEQEMGDAIELVTAAEKEWRLEQVVGRGRA